ncbi:MAG: hypothetical protein C0412_14370 [Flavobacterium sp.]|nr:hypothetical protein [Flavobacterium sp.]
MEKLISDKKQIYMSAIKGLFKVLKSLDTSTENRDQMAIRLSNAKCNLEVAMSYHEVTSQLEQEYYNKASGCSVKAQADNLFDYNSFLEN